VARRATLPDLAGSHAIVTGANTGIGRVTALELARAGAAVVLACRSEAKATPVVDAIRAETGNSAVSFMPIDLGDLSSVRAFAVAWRASGRPLHLLVNNAGLAGHRGVTVDGFELQFGVNHLGPYLLTELLLDALIASAPARIVNVSSEAHANPSGIPWDRLRGSTWTVAGFEEYGISKLANVLHARELARRLEGTGVVTASLHPGRVATEVWRRIPWPIDALVKLFMISPEQGAQTTLTCCVSDEVVTHSGAFWWDSARRDPSQLALDRSLEDELARRSRAWVGLD
jgi:retinol dehydrogenase-12